MAGIKLLKISSTLTSFLRPIAVRPCHHLASASYAQTLLNIPETKVSTLENGFKIASEVSESTAATVGLWIDAGSRFETSETNGLANFFEHIAFKGTSQRSEKDLEIEIQKMGAEFNSYTDREEMAFYAQCHARDIPKAVDILADVIKNNNFGDQQMEEARENVLRELKEAETNLKLVAFDYLHLTGYQGTPLAQSVLGPTSNIKNFTRDDLAFYIRNNFVAPRIALVASGDIDHNELVKLAEKHFSSVPFNYTSEIPMIRPCRFTGSDVRDRDDWQPFAHTIIAVETCGHDSPDIYPLMLAKTIVGSWDRTLASSPHTCNKLIQNIYKGSGMHSFEAFHILYRDTGLWGIYFVTDKYTMDDFIFNVQNEWMKLCINIKESELELAKKFLRYNLLESLDGTTNTCADIGRQVLHYGKRRSIIEMDENIQAVTLKQLKDTCMKYIYDRCPAVASVGPNEALPDYTRIRANMYWLRY